MQVYDEPALARWSAEPAKAAGATRNPFERDRARVLHSSALRRLAAKTQVVVVGEDDFPRTRLTHSLECAQIGRELAAALGADADLVDAACLAHDLGHPPFGHNGEDALDEAAVAIGGFEGNAQSLRVLTRLEVKVPDAGLNLTRATLDAVCKYPWLRRDGQRKFGAYDDQREVFDWIRQGAAEGRRCLEAQVMDWADDVAYSVHDLEDGIHAGHVPTTALDSATVRDELCALTAEREPTLDPATFSAALDELLAQPWWLHSFDGGTAALCALKRTTTELIGRFCGAALGATREVYGDGSLRRYAADLVVPEAARVECALLKAVTGYFVMGRAGADAGQTREREVVLELVDVLLERGEEALSPALGEAFRAATGEGARSRVVIDQVASLTDTSAWTWLARLAG